MLLHKDGLTPNIDLSVDEQTVEQVTSFKFLGINIDNTLSFNLHFTELHSKLLKATFIIRHLSKLLTLTGLNSLYYAYYHTHLTYGSVIWFLQLTKAAQKILYQLQK